MSLLKKSKLFGGRIEPACAYCEHGISASDNIMIICDRRGITAPYYRCKRFVYSPLKRVPKPAPKLQEFSEKDFTL